ncbi:radical SAM protein [Nocardia asteroides]|uniref:radical SAM protein n=1 Tax=Nocardia asteroides TaxID=1824 RepID=UPI00342A31A7
MLRSVIDAVNECNLRCSHCHPGEAWKHQQLPARKVAAALEAAETAGVLEVVLSGGEITLHDDFGAMLEATNLLERTASTLITNATRLTAEAADHGPMVPAFDRRVRASDPVRPQGRTTLRSNRLRPGQSQRRTAARHQGHQQ